MLVRLRTVGIGGRLQAAVRLDGRSQLGTAEAEEVVVAVGQAHGVERRCAGVAKRPLARGVATRRSAAASRAGVVEQAPAARASCAGPPPRRRAERRVRPAW